MEEMLVVGSGGQGREVIDTVNMMNSAEKKYRIVGILDDNTLLHGRNVLGHTVLGGISKVVEYPGASITIAVGNPRVKQVLASKINQLLRTPKFATVIHPKSSVSSYADIGQGVIVAPGAVVSTNAKVGDHVLINYSASVGHDSIVHDFASIQPGARVNGNSLVATGAFVGTNSALNEGVSVGEWSVIANSAAVISDVPPNVMVAGVPARVKKHLG